MEFEMNCYLCHEPLTSDDFKEGKIIYKTKTIIAHTKCWDAIQDLEEAKICKK